MGDPECTHLITQPKLLQKSFLQTEKSLVMQTKMYFKAQIYAKSGDLRINMTFKSGTVIHAYAQLLVLIT